MPEEKKDPIQRIHDLHYNLVNDSKIEELRDVIKLLETRIAALESENK